MKDINKNQFQQSRQIFSVLVLTGILSLSLSAGLTIIDSAIAAPGHLAQTVDGQSDRLPHSVANAVLQDLSNREGIQVSKLKIVEFSQQNWPNGCLGLAQPDELCTQVLVEGWRVVVSDGNQKWVYRTDGSGRNIRLENQNETASLPNAVADAVIKDAAERIKLQIVQAEKRQWSDSCLGLGGPAELCAAVVVPGWLVTVVAGQQRLVYRTNESGSVVRFDEAASQIGDAGTIKPVPISESQLPLPSGVIFRAINSGGFADLTTQINLQNDGRLIRVRNNRDGTTSQTQLSRISQQQVQQFQQLLQQQFAQFNGLEYPPPAGAADYITVTLTSPAGTTRYADIASDRLPSSLQTIIQAWNQLLSGS